MAATPDIIPSELTLEIGDDPSPERFMRAARAFFGYVQELSNQVASGGAEAPRWAVRVREGSDLLALVPATEATELHRHVWERAGSGVRDLLAGGLDTSSLPEPAIKHLTVLSELATGPRDRPTYLRLWTQKQAQVIDGTIANMVREDERLDYEDHGTVEGLIDTVQDRDGRLQFRVRDPAMGSIVMCQFKEDQLATAFSTFRKRVEVSGVVRYRKNGAPKSIRVERIEELPSDEELPTAADVRGILRTA